MTVSAIVTSRVAYRKVERGTGASHRRNSSTALRDQARVRHEGVALVGVGEQCGDAVSDQAGGGVVAGDDELEHRGQQLLPGEHAVPARAHQVADEVLGRRRPPAVDEVGQEADDVVRHGHRLGRGLAPEYGASSVANQPTSRRWSVRSMPRSSPMTANGSGRAYSATRSTGLLVGGEVVQEVGRDLPDARLERLQPGLGERLVASRRSGCGRAGR